MKILILSDVAPGPTDQGDTIRLTKFTNYLSKRNEVTVLTFSKVRQDALRSIVVPPPSPVCKLLRSVLAPHLPATVASRRTARMRRAIKELTAREKFDVAFVYQHKMAAYLPLLNCPAVVDLTDALSLYYGRVASHAGWGGRIFYSWEEAKTRRFERDLLGQRTLCLLASEVDAQYLHSLVGGARIEVLPNGVDTQYFSPSHETSHGSDLVFMGNMAYYPNEDGLLFFYRKVFPLVLARYGGARLVVVGKNPPASIRVLQADPAVKVTGYVSDVRPYIGAAGVFVSPLRFGAGTRLKILEAMAMGKAVVSTSLGVEGLKVTTGVDLEVADEPGGMAEKIVELLRDEGKRVALGKQARETVLKDYRWERICSPLEDLLITEVLGR